MTTTLTFRLDKAQRDRLRARAAAAGKTESELLREIIERELRVEKRTAALRKVCGKLAAPQGKADAWEQELRDRNWRPR